MPVVCRHRITGIIAAAQLRNHYDLMYYGAVWWENIEAAEASVMKRLADLGFEHPEDWDLLEISDQRLKVMNVKFNNDLKRVLRMEKDGTLQLRETFDRSGDVDSD